MAGMLPGVECARRRRFHQGGGWMDSQCSGGNGRTRRSAFCLYITSNHESHLSSSSSSLQRNTTNQSFRDEKLGGVAREAKERLDERLRAPKKPEIKRQSSKKSGRSENDGRGSGPVVLGDLPTEVFGSKKTSSSNTMRFISWAKLGWRASDQDECAVCLEKFKAGETLLHLPCAHRFHSRCLVPWLESSSQCPCCRLRILV